MMVNFTRTIQSLLVVSAVTLAGSDAFADSILRRDGSNPIKAPVVKVTATEITFLLAGQPQPLSLDQVAGIEFDEKPAIYKAAENSFKLGNYEASAKNFAKTAKLPKPKWAKQYGLYYEAKSYLLGGKTDDAIKAYKSFLSSQTDSMFITEAALDLADAYIAADKVSDAEKVIKQAASNKQASKFDFYKSMVKMGEGKLDIAKKDYKRAHRNLNSLKGRTMSKYPGLAGQASALAARALVEGKQYKEAISYTKALIDELGKDDATTAMKRQLPSAYANLGKAYFESAAAKSGADAHEQYEFARWAFLRVLVLYSGSNDIHDARYYVARCFESLIPKEQDVAKKRAISLYSEISKRTPQSPWVEEAKKRLKTLKS